MVSLFSARSFEPLNAPQRRTPNAERRNDGNDGNAY